VIAGNN